MSSISQLDRKDQIQIGYQANLETGALEKLGESAWGSIPAGHNRAHTGPYCMTASQSGMRFYIWEKGQERKLLYGVPLEQRGQESGAQ